MRHGFCKKVNLNVSHSRQGTNDLDKEGEKPPDLPFTVQFFNTAMAIPKLRQFWCSQQITMKPVGHY